MSQTRPHRSTFAMASVVLAVAVAIGACALPGSLPAQNATQTAQAEATALQQTVEAAVTASAVPTTPAATATEAATPTPAATATVTPTPTPSTPVAVVNEPTNCRSGNGSVFDLIYTAAAGTELTITGQTTLTDYILVENPNRPGTSCWLYTRYVEIRGDISNLPVSTPPPTPTPSLAFTVSYAAMEGCVGWDPEFQITNTGGVTLQSWQAVVEDQDTGTSHTATANNFDELNGCPVANGIPQLDPGDSGYAYGWSFTYDPSGHSMRATIKVCTGSNLSGMCGSQTITFTP
ncbi:MAG: hypothetical protein R3191_04640 [Anaerolineales bacterium]|nr:hypothetical protein [Anaerolineales bacterium]